VTKGKVFTVSNELVTEAETIEEAFEMARDAADGLKKVRANAA
jgi:hypothetical protein